MKACLWSFIITGLFVQCVLGQCNVGQFECSDRSCIPMSYKCDGRKNCVDWSDETSSLCGGDCSYRPDGYRCANGKCVGLQDVCDNYNDCGDYSDETDCAYCRTSSTFKCKNKRCIQHSKKCDGKNDCGDFSDELDPSCKAYSCYYHQCKNGNCYSRSQICDGYNDCGDFTDEKNCRYCKGDKYRCRDGNCISKAWLCDGDVDCPLGDDEHNCECSDKTMLRCGSGECIDYDQICDNQKDCADLSDEHMCIGNMTHGWFGPSAEYDCNCNGECHPVTGICNGHCKDGWTGPTCQIVKVNFRTPEQHVGDTIIKAPASVDGDKSTCPPVSIGMPSAWWDVNITQSVYLRRMRIYNKKDTSHLTRLQNVFRGKCTWNNDFADVGYLDVICNVTVRTNRVQLLATSTKELGHETYGSIPSFQICEFQIIVCSNNSFGGQCEKTCNCLNEEPCDDGTGECKTGCLPGWTGRACDQRTLIKELESRVTTTKTSYRDQSTSIKELESTVTTTKTSYRDQSTSIKELESTVTTTKISYRGQCNVGRFECGDGSCILMSQTCDGRKNCVDWSDETSSLCGGDCSYRPDGYRCANGKCVGLQDVCDNYNDCGDYSDETDCAYCRTSSTFKCKNKRCIQHSKKCDGKNDCGDFSDELDPSCKAYTCYYHQCKNGNCYSRSQKCDGYNDCGDFTDEKNCRYCKGDKYRCRDGNCIPKVWLCDGDVDCPLGDDEHNCECSDKTMLRCGSGECIDYDQICDNQKDCADLSDEHMCIGNMTQGWFGPFAEYDCNCNGECHPVTGICNGHCKDGWTGPTCQIVKVNFRTPEQHVGDTIIKAPASVDGDKSTCPPVSIGMPSAWWDVNITQSVYLRRMRIYNKKDTSHLTRLQNVFRGKCTWNNDFTDVGYLDVLCNVTVRTNRVQLLTTSTKELGHETYGSIPSFQICEFQIIVCSNNSFGGQCEKTCNCLNEEPCDDGTGECKTGCIPGWTGRACDQRNSTSTSTTIRYEHAGGSAFNVRPSYAVIFLITILIVL